MKVHQGAYTFSLELDAPLIRPSKTSSALVDALPKNMKKEGLQNLSKLVDQKAEGVWAQSRLMVAFGLTAPEESDTTPTVVDASLKAGTDAEDEEEGVIFRCLADKDGRTRVHFDGKAKKEEAKRIANAFWKILLSEPAELDDYAAETVDSSGAKVAYGVRDGRCFYGDPDDEDIDIPAVAAAAAAGKGAFDDFDPVAMVDDDDDWMRSGWEDDEDEDDDDGGFGSFSGIGDDEDDY